MSASRSYLKLSVAPIRPHLRPALARNAIAKTAEPPRSAAPDFIRFRQRHCDAVAVLRQEIGVPFRDMALALGAYDKNGNAYLLPDQRLSEAAQNRNLRRVAHTI